MTTKLNSMRVLEQHKIPYEVLTYDNSTRDAEEVAELIGLPPFMVYKTLIVQSEVAGKKPFIVMLPCDKKLDLKKMAVTTGEKKVKMAAHAEAEKWTGLQVGGISALMLMDKSWTVYMDKSATALQNIVISAGQRGLQLRVPVLPLLSLIRARLVEVTTDKDD